MLDSNSSLFCYLYFVNFVRMGHKRVCLSCRITLNIQAEDYSTDKHPCRRCGKEMIFILSHFRPPKKSDDKSWEVVEFLIKHGFYFQHIYQEGLSDYFKRSVNNYISYPTNIRDAQEFVEKYKQHARKRKDQFSN